MEAIPCIASYSKSWWQNFLPDIHILPWHITSISMWEVHTRSKRTCCKVLLLPTNWGSKPSWWMRCGFLSPATGIGIRDHHRALGKAADGDGLGAEYDPIPDLGEAIGPGAEPLDHADRLVTDDAAPRETTPVAPGDVQTAANFFMKSRRFKLWQENAEKTKGRIRERNAREEGRKKAAIC